MRSDSPSLDAHTASAACSAPWSLLARHLELPYPFLLDRAGAVSYAGSSPRSQIVVDASGRVREWEHGAWRDLDEHPIDALAGYVERNAADVRREERRGADAVSAAVTSAQPALLSLHPALRDSAAPARSGGADDVPLPLCGAAETPPRTVGFLAYELGTFVERVGVPARDPAGLPLAVLTTYDRIDAWDTRTTETWTIEYEGAPRLRSAAQAAPPPLATNRWCSAIAHVDAQAAYRRGFARIVAAIRAGEIYQANLARRLEVDFERGGAGAAHAYARLRAVQPVPHGAFLDLGSRQILSNSPECFLRISGDLVETFPIKGTRPRHGDDGADTRAAAELACDEKERAEHLMIVDLERNDLGRVARVGSVEIGELASVRSFATVHHLETAVRARLRPDATLADVLRATFPGGSITGAPKIRAMEIIAEVEPQARGVYTGAIGCFNGARAASLNVAIRTAVACRGRAQYCTGGGIVADSVLEREWEETAVKARAFLAAVGTEAAGVRAAG